MRYVFGDSTLDTRLYALHRAGHTIQLRPKVFQVLNYLIAHSERVVSRQELYEQVWPDQYSSDAALESAIRAARQVLGDTGRTQQYIQTLHGYGYRFIATVTMHPDAASGATVEVAPPSLAPATPCVQACVEAMALPVPSVVSGDAAGVSPPDAAAPGLPALGGLAGERKMVTILSCTLAHAPALRKRLGLDALHRLMHVLYTLARNEVQRYGGTLQPVTEECVVALFGVPVAQEDHARRAALAALGLRQRVAAHRATMEISCGGALAVRMGVHTGLVAVGGLGEAAEGTAAVVSDTASLAIALQEHAAPGMILCSDTTTRLVQTVVEVEAVGPVPVGRPSTSVMAFQVLGRRPLRAPMAPHEARPQRRFVGRGRELAILQALLARVEDSQGHVVGIMGDPGVGKSRLLHEFCRGLAGRRLTYLRGRCLSYGSATPYFPLLDLLRHNCGLTERDSPAAITAKVRQSLQEVGMAPDAWAPYLLQLLGLEAATDELAGLSPQVIKARTFEALVQMSINGSRRRPLVLEVEDLHWIDATSEEWLVTLVERMGRVPILVLVSYRPGYRTRWMEKSYAMQLTLPPLTLHESRQVLQAILPPAQVSVALRQAILTKADGNPFFLEELARTVVEQDVNHLFLAVPDTVHAVVAAHIDHLPPAEKCLLQAAAVIGQAVPVPLLQALAGLSEEDMHRGLRALQAAEFVYEAALVPTPTYAFKHALIQEVAYQSLLPHTRRQIHQRIAHVLEAQFPDLAATQPALLAYHYTEAGLHAQAVVYWQQAGQPAFTQSAHREAMAHLTTGLELHKTLPETPANCSKSWHSSSPWVRRCSPPRGTHRRTRNGPMSGPTNCAGTWGTRRI